MFNFGIAFSAMQPGLNVYRFRASAKRLYRKRLRLDYPCSVHDFSLSPSCVVFYLSPYILDMEALIQEGRTLMDALRWEPERGSQLCMVSHDSGEEAATIPIGQRYCLHLINCFEADTRLMVDVIEYDRPLDDQYQVVPDLFTKQSEGQPVRFVMDMKSRDVIEQREIAYCLVPDFPSIDPRLITQPYGDFWMLGMSATGRHGRKFFDQLVHADWTAATAGDIYQAPTMQYLGGEAIFIHSDIAELIELTKAGKKPLLYRSAADFNITAFFIPKCMLPFLEVPLMFPICYTPWGCTKSATNLKRLTFSQTIGSLWQDEILRSRVDRCHRWVPGQVER